MRLEDALLDRNPLVRQQLAETLVERLRLFGASSVDEAGPAPFAQVGVERKLAHGQHAALHIGQPQVHFTTVVLKDAQPGDLARQQRGFGFAVYMRHTQQHQETSANLTHNLPIDGHTGGTDPLNYSTHRGKFTFDKQNKRSYNEIMSTMRIAPDPYEKLSLLDDAMRFEPAGSEPLTEKEPAGSRRPKPLPCISEVTTPTGKKPVMKAMMTTACEKNCYYCPFRAGRSQTQRITFTPDEMAKTFDTIQRAGLVEGMFLSSGIIKGGAPAQDKIIDTAEILRRKYSYRGYIHLKVMPGAEYDQIRRAMQLADRVSINLEGPTPQRLAALAPKKDYWTEIFSRVQWIAELRRREGLRASVVTQFVVGAVGDTDLELLQVSDVLYNQFGLRRAYYSAFHPSSRRPSRTWRRRQTSASCACIRPASCCETTAGTWKTSPLPATPTCRSTSIPSWRGRPRTCALPPSKSTGPTAPNCCAFRASAPRAPTPSWRPAGEPR